MGIVSVILAFLIISVVSVYLYTGGFKSSSTPAKTTSLIKQVDKAKDVKIKSDFSSIKTALSAYRAGTGDYPQTIEDLKKLNVVSGILVNPVDNTPYKYEYLEGTYTLSTTLSDGTVYQVSP